MSDDNQSPTPSNQPDDVLLPSPLLLDVMRAIVPVGAILLAASVFVVNLVRGGEPVTAGIRAAVVLLSSGLLGWIANYLLASLFVWLLGMLKPKASAAARATSTQSWEA